MRKRLWALLAAGGFALVAALPPLPAAAAGATVSFSATSIDFGSAPWLQPAPTQSLILTNNGDAPLDVCCADMSGVPFIPQDFIVFLDQCSFHTLTPGGQCSISIRFTPQTGGPRTATLSIFDNAPGSPQQVTLTGTGTGGVIRFSPSFLNFGTVQAGTTSAPLTFTAVNAGDGPATISHAALGPSPPNSSWFAITQNGCAGATLGAGQRCTISATVTPTAVTSGFQTVTFVDNIGSGQQRFDLGAAGGGPLVDIFGTVPRLNQGVGTSAPIVLPVFDAGTQPLQISSIALDNASAGFTIARDGCSGTTLPLNTPFNSPPPTCEMDLVFSPPAAGSFSANLVFHDNEFGGTHSVPLSSSGYAPVAVLSTNAIDFGFQATGVQSVAQIVTLSNPSPQSLTVSSVSLNGASVFSLNNNACTGVMVAPGGSCTVGVAFTPPFPYLFNATLAFATTAPVPVQTVAIRGEGQSPTFSISSNLLHFGNQHVNVASSSQTITVTNTSGGPLSFFYLGDLPINRSGCVGQIAAGATCTVSVTVTPSAVGTQTGILKIVDSSSPPNQQVIDVDWTGTSGEVFVSGDNLNSIFQRVGTTVTRSAVIINGGSDVLRLGQVSLTTASPAVIASDGCSNQSLALLGHCFITLTVNPVVAGAWSTSLSVPSDSVVGTHPTNVGVSGVADTPSPVLSPASVSFPPQAVGTVAATKVAWLNDGLVPFLGAQPLTISTITLGGSDASAFRVVWDGCTGTTIDAAFSCPVAFAFAPGTAGTFNASLLLSDDGVGSPQSVALSGIGTAPATVSPQQVDFGQVAINSKSAPAPVTLTNSGSTAFTVSRVSLSGPNKGDYSITSDGCMSHALAPGQSCQIAIVFRPEGAGARMAVLTFTDGAANSPQTVALTGTGAAR